MFSFKKPIRSVSRCVFMSLHIHNKLSSASI